MTIKGMISSSGKKLAAPLNRASRPFQGIWPRPRDAIIGMIALVIVSFTLSTYSPSLARSASELASGNKYLALIDGFLNPYRNRHLLLKSGLPIYDLRISHQEYAVVEDVVREARKQGWMSEDLKVWVNAKLIYEGEEYDVKVRVRGDLPPHWIGPKKSWAIKFGKQAINDNGEVRQEPVYFQGKRRINLIIPEDRDYAVAPFVNLVMREAGLIVPHDQFVVLRINGAVQGLYYEAEDFDNSLLAAHQRPETTIFGQNDRAMHFDQYTKYGTPGASDAEYDLGSMRREVDEQGELAMRAMQVLIDHSLNPTAANFRRVRAVLDWDKYLRFRVLTTLFNTNHVRFGSDNFKLYYDPSRGLLEPVPWDVHLTRMPKEPGTIDFWNSHGPDEIQRSTLLDPELRLQRNKVLWELVSDGGENIIGKFNDIHERIRPLAWADVLSKPTQGYKMDVLKKDFEYNVHRVYKVLSLSSANFMYRLEANDLATLEVVTTNFSGVQLREIEISDPDVFEGQYQLYQDINDNGELDRGDSLLEETTALSGRVRFALENYVLPEVRYDSDIIDGRYWEYFDTLGGRARFFLVGKLTPAKRHPLDWAPPDIRVAAVNAVTGFEIPSAFIVQGAPLPADSIAISAYDASDPFDLDAPERTLPEFLQAHPQFRASSERPGAAELSGSVTISDTVIVPRSVHLILKPGTEITMLPSANLVAYGGLTAVGTAEKRIRIHGNESKEAWGTFAVVRPPQEVTLRYADVQDGGQAQVNGLLFTGGFAVYDGDLRLEQCRFTDMQSEDGINLKNGHIVMQDCVVANAASDAIDIDFGTGEVRNSQFINIKGDGVDLSGSKVTVANNRFENVGDKGVSVGEDSHPIIINNLFRGCQIAISSKDRSHARVAYSTFIDNVLAIEVKRKKPMFGPGSGEFINNVFSGNQVLLEEDYFSKGLATIQNSVVDGQSNCATCQIGTTPFRSVETGDYRLTPATMDRSSFEAAPLDWAESWMKDNGYTAQQPGIFTDLRYQY